MGKSKGKQQEEAALAQNNQYKAEDQQWKNSGQLRAWKQAKYLWDNPGLDPHGLQAAKANLAERTGAIYGGEADILRRNAAVTGNANDVGLAPQLQRATAERARMETTGNNNIDLGNAELAHQTRMALPGVNLSIAGLNQQGVDAAMGNNTSLINSRMQVDNNPIWAQLAKSGISAAGSAFGGAGTRAAFGSQSQG